MDLPTLPRRSWLERTSCALGAALACIGGAGLTGFQPWANLTPFRAEEAACVLVLGAVLFLREFVGRWAGWLALIPGLIGGLILGGSLFNRDLHLGGLEAGGNLFDTAGTSSRVAAMAACCLTLAAIALVWHATGTRKRGRLLFEAISGSVLAAIGFATLLGYSTSLSAIYDWGSSTPISPFTAVSLLLLGLALLLLAWRANQRMERGPPAWAPIPAVIACMTLTLILWLGLRERELYYVHRETRDAMDQFATQVGLEINRQEEEFKDIARHWSEIPDNDYDAWSFDANEQMRDSGPMGCVSISYVDSQPARDPALPGERDFPEHRSHASTSRRSSICRRLRKTPPSCSTPGRDSRPSRPPSNSSGTRSRPQPASRATPSRASSSMPRS